MNEVDTLQARIKEIQESCDHDFRVVEEPKLTETNVSGVFYGRLAPGHVSAYIIFELACTKCSLGRKTALDQTCPRCLVSMELGQCLGAGSREKYFGRPYIHYAIVLSTCPKCRFTVASDEWDQ